jgi:hypothetical protein
MDADRCDRSSLGLQDFGGTAVGEHRPPPPTRRPATLGSKKGQDDCLRPAALGVAAAFLARLENGSGGRFDEENRAARAYLARSGT